MLTRDGQAFRFTFSKSLAEHIQRYCGPEGLDLRRVQFRLGRPLAHGQVSRSGLYAITSRESKVLRITMFAEVAKLLTPDSWRQVYECWLVS